RALRGLRMTLTSALQVFLVGTAGGVLLEFIHWYGLRREGTLPDYAQRPFYWLVSAGMALAGGIFGWIFFCPLHRAERRRGCQEDLPARPQGQPRLCELSQHAPRLHAPVGIDINSRAGRGLVRCHGLRQCVRSGLALG